MRYFLILCCVWFGLTSSAVGAASLQLTQGEIRVPMPGRTVTAGYFTLQNTTNETVELVAASSPAFSQIELHQHIEQEGMMRMVEVESIELAAGATVIFQPGGLHLMLFEPLQPLNAGDTLPLTLHFADGKQLDVVLPLVAMPRR